MSAIINIQSTYPGWPVDRSQPATSPATPDAERSATVDSVEISDFGRALSRSADQSSLSLARIQALRQEIEDGTFESSARIEGTVQRLLEWLT
jgi:anti-sigma28 factor (negative regulator of flagellin synthesis)